ncbi:MAG: endolytic transglycosylase MltG [Chloroflexota bacterium]
MTIRSGGRPRDDQPEGGPYEPGAYATGQGEYAVPATRRRRGGGGGGLPGVIKFLVFALVLAAVVLIVLVTALRPIVTGTVVRWAADNPAALDYPFVHDLVRDDIGPNLTTPASSSPDQVEFVVAQGDTASAIAQRLQGEGFLKDGRAFVLIATDRSLTGALQAGTFLLRRNMTPDEVVSALLAPPKVPYLDIGLREGLRLEQVTAKLETMAGLQMDPKAFYEMVKHPPAKLLADYPWLQKVLPKGASLEGFLAPATYRVLPDTTPDELVRLMLDKWIARVGEARLNVPKERGMTFYQVLTLASLVEREARLDEERAKIAGVFQNRLNPKLFPTHLLGSDPTIFYINDTLHLQSLPIEDWKSYTFWAPLKEGTALPDGIREPLASYNTYVHGGLMPGPIATPTVASIDAALEPDTKDGYLYFLAKNDGSNTTAFAKTHKQHLANIERYSASPAP